jgi:serralysin
MPEIYGTNLPDTIDGSEGADTIYGWESYVNAGYGPPTDDDVLNGLGGRDYICGGAGDDLIHGGDGNDALYGGSPGYYDNASPGNDTLHGGNGDDVLADNGGTNVFYGDDGDDIIRLRGGSNSVYGGAGDDRIEIESNTVPIFVQAGSGYDLLFLSGLTTSFVLDMSGGSAVLNGTELFGFEEAYGYGSEFDDRLIGGTGGDTFLGEDGNDFLSGGNGFDFLAGDDGRDTLYAGAGDDEMSYWFYNTSEDTDTFDGGSGTDILNIYQYDVGGVAQSIIWANSFTFGPGVSVTGVEKLWVVTAEQNDTVSGGQLDDHIDGGRGKNLLSGLGGADELLAGNSRDLMYGGTGHDSLYGGNGNDRLDGGSGADLLFGGLGKDEFDFTTAPITGERDRIEDFDPVLDIIRLSGAAFDALPWGTLGDEYFVLGTRALDANDHILFDPVTGAVRYDEDGKGGKASVLFVTVVTADPLTAEDFRVISA